MMDALPPEKLDRLHRALAPLHRQYDSFARMLKVPLQSYGFLKAFQGFPVHPTRESVGYAAALLDTSDDALRWRAIKILQQVLPLQDQQENSRTYGIFPKYLEEKPFKIVQPDPNWCDFLATRLLQIILYNRHQLPSEIIIRIDTAILHAAYAIQRRNVPLDYTNIAIMGIYVTLTAAQVYKIPDLYKYALTRLRDFHDYTLDQGGFSEYNSPTYTTIALKVLGRLRLHIENAEAKPFINNLYRLAWEEIAYHFHASTLQWAGPHSRSYHTLLESEITALIERSTSERIVFGISDQYPAIDEHWLSLPCPEDLESYFLPLEKPHSTSRTLARKVPKQVLTTYLSPSFTIGTINYSDFWHQRRPLLMYWGGAKGASYLRLRCLYNGVDCAAAQFVSAQDESSILAGVSFATDINPINPYIPSKTQETGIPIKDLRLRLEFHVPSEAVEFNVSPPSSIDPKSPLHLCLGNLHVQILVPYAEFGSATPKWELQQTSSSLHLDLILWSGRKQLFRLSEMEEGAIALALQVTSDKPSTPNITLTRHEHCLDMSWNHLNLRLVTHPTDQRTLTTTVFPDSSTESVKVSGA